MSDNNERNVNNEDIYESRDVKNGIPQLDEEQYNQVEQKNKNMRSSISDDDNYQETYEDEDNDIINSLLNSSKSKKEDDNGVTKNVKNKLYKEGKSIFGKKKEVVDETSNDVYESQPLTSDNFVEQTNHEEVHDNIKENSSVDSDYQEPVVEEKKSSLFGKKKKDKKDVNIEPPSSYGNNNKDENIINVHDEDDVNTFEDIERTARMAKTKKGGLKGLLIVFGAVVIVGILFVGGTYLINTLKPNEQPPAVQQPEQIETPDDSFISTDNQATLYKQGVIKRILGNKVLIIPDGEKENTIYYVDNDSVLAKYKAGAHIEYGYVIRNYLPYITEAVEITEGQVIYKGIMTLNIMMDDKLVKFAYDASLEEEVKKIITGDTLQYVYEVVDGTYTIKNIINVKNLVTEDEDDESIPGKPGNLGDGYIFDPKEFYNEYIIIDSRGDESDDRVTVSSNIENNTIAFYSSLTGPIWIRHAWRSTDIMETVPSIDAIDVVLVLPDGTQITSSNIDKYGRMWLDGNIVNYAFKNPQVGEYKLIDNKASGTFLGEAMVHVMELSGYITIDKFGANLIDRDTLELIWNIGGVPDDGLEIEVYLTNDRFSTMIYKGSSKEESLHIIDKRTVSVSNLPRGQYDIIVKVKDIDMKTTADDPEIPVNTIQITAETITETRNMGILTIQ